MADELMTQEAFEDRLSEMIFRFTWKEKYPKTETFKEYDDSMDEVTAAYAAVLARIASLEAERRWIPVSERLPEEGIKVNILYDTPCVEDEPEVAVYMGDNLWLIGPEEYLDRVYCKVTHWMPLLPAPE